MSATNTTPDGRIRLVGKVHGVVNTMIEWADDPEGWSFKQFVSQEQLDAFAAENNLIILEREE